MSRLAWTAIGLAISGAAAAASTSLSVDCKTQLTRIDQLVCTDSRLIDMDDQYSRAYGRLLEVSPDPEAFRHGARQDLQWRHDNCQDKECLREWYGNIIPRYQALSRNASGTRRVDAGRTQPTEKQAGPRPESSARIALAYEQNALAAERKYLGKPVLITGMIADIGRDVGGDPYVAMEGGYRYVAIKLVFSNKQEDALEGLRTYQTIAVECIGLGVNMVPVFDCRKGTLR